MINSVVKSTQTIAVVSSFALQTLRDSFLPQPMKRVAYAKNTSEVSKKFLKLHNVETSVFKSRNDLFDDGPFFMVCNHLSYLDIFVLSQLFPALFITSKEMQRTPVLGTLCEAGGSIFVERRDPFAVRKDLADIRTAGATGSQVVLFPEGTSGSGESVHTFKRGLFMAAKQLALPVLPVCIRYLEVDGEPFSERNHLSIAWYGDHSFGSQFLKFLKTKSIKVQVGFLEPLPIDEKTDMRMVADKAQQRIRDFYHRGGFPKWKGEP